MKNKIFDKNLYFEGIRQNRLTGILACVIFFIITALTPLGDLAFNSFYIGRNATLNMSFVSSASILWVLIYLVVPILTINIFKFQNKRNKSDFYHSIPQSRVCLFLSFYASVATWIVLAILSSLISSAIFYALAPHFAMDYSTLLPTIFFYISSCLLVASTVAIAMTITGNLRSNIAVSILIMFLPTCLYHAFFSVIYANLDSILVSEKFGNFFGAKMNLPANFITALYGISKYGVGDSKLMLACLYTLILAIVYAGIATFLFARRKSESAEKSAPSKIWQSIYRIVFGFLFSLIPILLIYGSYISKEDYLNYSIMVSYIIVVIAYFLFEIITTKGVKTLKNALIGLLILAGLNGIMIGGMIITTNVILNFTPSADKIDSISLTLPNNNYIEEENMLYYVSSELNNYYSQHDMEIELTDENLKKLVSDGLNQSVDSIRSGEWYTSYYDLYTVKIKSGVRTVYRNINLSQDKVLKILSENEEYQKLYCELPEYDGKTVKASVLGAELKGKVRTSDETVAQMYELYRQKAKSDFNYAYNRAHDNELKYYSHFDYEYYDLNYAVMQIEINDGKYSSKIDVNLSSYSNMYLLPLYAKDYAQNNQEIKTKIISKIINTDGKNSYDFDVMIDLYLNSDKSYSKRYEANKKEVMLELSDILLSMDSKTDDYSNFVKVIVDRDYAYDYDYDNYDERDDAWQGDLIYYLPIDLTDNALDRLDNLLEYRLYYGDYEGQHLYYDDTEYYDEEDDVETEDMIIDFVSAASNSENIAEGNYGFVGLYPEIDISTGKPLYTEPYYTLDSDNGLMLDTSLENAWAVAEMSLQRANHRYRYAIITAKSDNPDNTQWIDLTIGGVCKPWEEWIAYYGYTLPSLTDEYITYIIDLNKNGVRNISCEGVDFGLNKGKAVSGNVCVSKIVCTDYVELD